MSSGRAHADRRALAAGERRFAILLVAPALLVLLATTTVPIAFLIWNSFQTINLAMPFLDGFAGLANYRQMSGDPAFWHSLQLTAIYTGSTVVMQLVIGLGLALLVLQIPRGQWLFRIFAILPIVLAPVVVGLFWRTLMFAPNFGMIDFATRALGLGTVNWLGSPTPALVSVIVIHTWQWTPFAFLVLLASLASLPEDLYEAARLDRASAWRRFIHITLPLLRPAIVIVIIMRAMTALSAFAAIYAATGGGPGTATEILNLYAYRISFTQLDFGYGSALAVALLVLTLAVSGFLFRIRTAGSGP
ncbi:multiple sugar transport system permease protein [Amaricoccus macauensis]|uniref:Multiple sugar transport system permease protein n=1 Tax=Amaricoccus macauensis TaxID=57001 RepID=A0A840SL02_9RHOB|nr:multiple sugar transport system permease protein [Amaricoccus macauensis]